VVTKYLRLTSRVALGTVQFGTAYGIVNHDGKVGEDEVWRIVSEAIAEGVILFDTAPSYGDAEEVLGRCLPADSELRIVTKTPALNRSDEELGELITAGYCASLRKLRRDSLYAILCHQPGELLGPHGDDIFGALESLKHAAMVEKVGLSAYSADQIDPLIGRYSFDLVQLPFNLLDQRVKRNGCLQRLKQQGIEVHARSAYLQGVLVADPGEVPPFLAAAKPYIDRYRRVLADTGLSPVQACLGFVLSEPGIDYCVIGTCSRLQLHEALNATQPSNVNFETFRECACDDVNCVDPSRWPAKCSEVAF
jgi:aryl-alcohol dehydrogenase-like predicted oxidoreductase